MYGLKSKKEELAEKKARLAAIQSTGDLTDELRAEVDSLVGVGEEGHADYKPGAIAQLSADIERYEKIEAATKANLKRGLGTAASAPVVSQTEPFARCESLQIPVRQQFRHGALKAFKGEHGEKQAYLAGMFFTAAFTGNQRATQWCKDHGIGFDVWNAGGENQNQLGGVLVPDEVERVVIDLREERGVARRESMVTGMAGDTKYIPRRTGGLSAYFVDENPSSSITESDKNWNSVRLVARTLATLSRYSLQLSDDSIISIGDDIASEIAYAFADKEDQCLFNGDGTSTYGGIVGLKNGTAAGSTYTALAGNTAFSTLDLVDFEAMVGKLPQYAEPNAKWYISKAGWAASMMRLIDAAGGNTWRDLASGKRELSFLGYPVVISQVMNNTLGAQTSTSGLCYFGDMRQAVAFGNRRGVSVLQSEHRYMEYNQIGIRGMERFDINYHERGDANNAGSIIMLATPGG